MQTNPMPDIAESDLRAARQFLASGRENEDGAADTSSPDRSAARSRGPRSLNIGSVPLSHGIARARMRGAHARPKD